MIKLTGEWKKADKLFRQLPGIMQSNLALATAKSAKRCEKYMVKGIAQTRPEWDPLKPETIRRKGSSKPLVDHGDLMGNITSKKIMPATHFVGVLRTAKNKKGDKLVDIGAVHEYGTHNGTIPPRPFIRPGLEESKDDTAKFHKDAIRASLRGKQYVA